MLQPETVPVTRIRPLRRAEYDKLIELGAFHDERIELLYGRLVQMSPQGNRHAAAVQWLTMALVPAVVGRAAARIQLPFAASDFSQPEPDVALCPPGEYRDAHPHEALLIIEVADSSLAEDRAKALLYAESGVGEYWIIDLEGGAIEVYSQPSGGKYAQVRRLQRGAVLSPERLGDLRIDTTGLLPDRQQ